MYLFMNIGRMFQSIFICILHQYGSNIRKICYTFYLVFINRIFRSLLQISDYVERNIFRSPYLNLGKVVGWFESSWTRYTFFANLSGIITSFLVKINAYYFWTLRPVYVGCLKNSYSLNLKRDRTFQYNRFININH